MRLLSFNETTPRLTTALKSSDLKGMINKKFEERLVTYCKIGEQADTNLRRGRVTEALASYNEVIGQLEKNGDVDSYLMAKITLGVLRCYIKAGDFKNAFTVWNTSLEDGVHGVGIYALESAQTTVHDMITYDMLCAYLHTLTDSPARDSAAAVNQYLSRVCEHAVEQGDRAMLHQALGNWKLHLRDLFKGSIPHEFAQPLISFEKEFGEPVKPRPLDFPMPSSWEKPHDFREMSRVVQLRDVAPHKKHRSGRKTAV